MDSSFRITKVLYISQIKQSLDDIKKHRTSLKKTFAEVYKDRNTAELKGKYRVSKVGSGLKFHA